MSKPTNEQIAHDLAISWVADAWRTGEVTEQNSVALYISSYKKFLDELNRQH